jgi:uncharacterized membrane protein YqhA
MSVKDGVGYADGMMLNPDEIAEKFHSLSSSAPIVRHNDDDKESNIIIVVLGLVGVVLVVGLIALAFIH